MNLLKSKAFVASILLLSLTTMNAALKVGSKAPDFTLSDETGTQYTLSAMKGNNVAIFFYPKADSFSVNCTAQACSIRKGSSALKDANITVWGISYDSPEKLKEFKKTNHLTFPLLSDASKKVSKLYHASGWFFPDRVTFLIDEEGTLVAILRDIEVSDHADQILKAFKKA
jgi:peroxiredoxin Q/BCP